MQSISRSSPSAGAPLVPTTRQLLEEASNRAVNAIDQIVNDYIGSRLLDIRDPLRKQFEALDARQATRVLNLMGTPWAVRLVEAGLPSGLDDFLDRILELQAKGKFTGSLVDVFGEVVPRLLDMQCNDSDAVALFVLRIGQSDQISPLEKEQIIWGTQGAADPTAAAGGHWARAGGNEEMQAALLKDVERRRREARPAAAPEVPPQEPVPCCTLL